MSDSNFRAPSTRKSVSTTFLRSLAIRLSSHRLSFVLDDLSELIREHQQFGDRESLHLRERLVSVAADESEELEESFSSGAAILRRLYGHRVKGKADAGQLEAERVEPSYSALTTRLARKACVLAPPGECRLL